MKQRTATAGAVSQWLTADCTDEQDYTDSNWTATARKKNFKVSYFAIAFIGNDRYNTV